MRNDAIKGRINLVVGRREGGADGAALPAQNVAFGCHEVALSETDERRGAQREGVLYEGGGEVSQWKLRHRQREEETRAAGPLWPVEKRR